MAFWCCFGLQWVPNFGDYHDWTCVSSCDHWLCVLHTLTQMCLVMPYTCITYAHHMHTWSTHLNNCQLSCISLILHVLALITWVCDIVFVPVQDFVLICWANLVPIKLCSYLCFCTCFSILCLFLQMSPLKKSAMKGGSSNEKELVIDLDSFTPKSKRTRSSTRLYDVDKFRSYATFQDYEKYFKDAPLLVERVVEQATLLDTNIPKWFATKDWNFLLSSFEESYENMVKEFYANAIFEGDEPEWWVKGRTPTYLANILCINRPMFPKPSVYDDLDPEQDLLWEF